MKKLFSTPILTLKAPLGVWGRHFSMKRAKLCFMLFIFHFPFSIPCKAQCTLQFQCPPIAVSFTFTSPGSIQTWSVPSGVTQITVNAGGAAGGTGTYAGGNGAVISATVTVTPNQTLNILVGDEGASYIENASYAGGGGGATFIWDNSNTTISSSPLIIAGGGGGGGYSSIGSYASTTTAANEQPNEGAAGADGTGGAGGIEYQIYGAGGGGAGFISSGTAGESGTYTGGGGGVYPNAGITPGSGGTGGDYGSIGGGYGGGGGAGAAAGGGGGGYAGGGGGSDNDPSYDAGGGGGGSCVNGSNPVTASATNTGNGFATIYYNGPVITINQNVTCNGGNNGNISSPVAMGGTSPYTYSWTPAGGSDTSASNLSAGTYTITATDANGCTASASAAITQPPAIIISIASQINESCYGTGTGSVAANAAIGGNLPYSYSWSSGKGTNLTVSNLSAGIYTITVTDANSCNATASVAVTQPAAVTVITNEAYSGCNNTPNATVVTSSGGGTGTITYKWSNSATGAILLAGTGTYSVTATDTHGCSATASVTITQPAAVTASVSLVVAPVCNGGAGMATASTGGGTGIITYQWSNSATGATLTAGAGTYTITATDIHGCFATASATITQPAAITASASQTAVPTCYGSTNGTASASSGGGIGTIIYHWSNSATGASLTAGAGTYSVTATDTHGCSATASVTITQPVAITASASQTVVPTCYGSTNGTVSASSGGGIGTVTYKWSNSATGASLTAIAGTYTLTATDTHGCSPTASVTITQPNLVTVSASQASVPSCYGNTNGTAIASSGGGTGTVTYKWSNNATGTTLTAGAGTYSLTATDAHGCTTTASVSITQPSQLQLFDYLTASFSYTGSVQTWAVPASVTAITIQATGGGGGIDLGNNFFGGGGATITGIVSVTSGHILDIVAGGVGTSVEYSGGGGGGGSFVWDNTTTTLLAVAGGGGGAGDYNGYNGSTTATPNPSGGSGENGGTALGINAGGGGAGFLGNGGGGSGNNQGFGGKDKVNGFAGGAPANYNPGATGGYGGGGGGGYDGGGGGGGYNGGDGLASLLLNTPGYGAGGGSYINGSLTAVSVCCGFENGSVVITYPAPPVPFVNQNVTCNSGSNGSITSPTPVGGVSPYTYSWSPNGGSSAIATSLTTGTYTITVNDSHGCSVSVSAIITQPAAVTARATQIIAPTCYGNTNGTATATSSGGTGPITYKWNNNLTTTGTTLTTGAGTYLVTATDINGCSATASVNITQPNVITASTTQTAAPNCFGGVNGSATATSGGGTGTITYKWNNNATGTLLIGIAGTYTVIATDSKGCSATASVTITQPAASTASAIQTGTPSCYGQTNGMTVVSSGGGTGAITYKWNNNAMGATLTAGAGTYSVTATDTHGCSSVTSITVTQPGIVSVHASQTLAGCNGMNNANATASASGGAGSYTYKWNNNNSTTGATLTAGVGTYTITATDTHGCSGTASTTITQPNVVTVHTNETFSGCNGMSNATATVSGSGGTAPFTYKWNNNNSTTGATLTAGAGTYTATATDVNGCLATISISITQPAALADGTPVHNSDITCNGNANGNATAATPTGGTSPYTFTWNSGTTSTNSNNSSLSAGTYTVTVTDAHGCTVNASGIITITQPSVVTVNSISETLAPACYGSTNGTATAGASGGTGAITYKWNNSHTTTGATLTAAGAGTYTITATDTHGCTATANVTITQPTAVTITNLTTTPATVTTCPTNGTATANASGGTGTVTYKWNNSATGATLSAGTGTYTATATDTHGCTVTRSATIGSTPCPVPGKTSTHHGSGDSAEGEQLVNIQDAPMLYQNIPNPFTLTTKISYYLPEGIPIAIGRAIIVFYDIYGSRIKMIELSQTGEGTINIMPNSLSAGFYSYSLVVNGKVIDTKRMVLVK